MGMVAVAVCTPPIGLGLATFVQKYKFNHSEREMGKASFTMGLFGITEGAILSQRKIHCALYLQTSLVQ